MIFIIMIIIMIMISVIIIILIENLQQNYYLIIGQVGELARKAYKT